MLITLDEWLIIVAGLITMIGIAAGAVLALIA